ncbi:MAG: LPS export ABC transporter periplasmic protein LptC [Rickettsiales bacterium]|nr:LPS export ABC transporter periplasmic protein LptC [Rickettsiales bacterium]
MTKSGLLNQLEPQEVERQLSRIPIYLRLLSMSKLALGVVVILLIAAVVVVPFIKSEDEGVRIALTQTPIESSAEKPVMKNPRYESVDGDNQPFTIRASEAIQKDESEVLLKQVKADVALNNGLWLALSAASGVLEITAQKMFLNEKVHLIASNGYELQSDKVYVDMKRNLVRSHTGVSGQGLMGNVTADEFLIEGNSQRVLFEKNVKLKIFP